MRSGSAIQFPPSPGAGPLQYSPGGGVYANRGNNYRPSYQVDSSAVVNIGAGGGGGASMFVPSSSSSAFAPILSGGATASRYDATSGTSFLAASANGPSSVAALFGPGAQQQPQQQQFSLYSAAPAGASDLYGGVGEGPPNAVRRVRSPRGRGPRGRAAGTNASMSGGGGFIPDAAAANLGFQQQFLPGDADVTAASSGYYGALPPAAQQQQGNGSMYGAGLQPPAAYQQQPGGFAGGASSRSNSGAGRAVFPNQPAAVGSDFQPSRSGAKYRRDSESNLLSFGSGGSSLETPPVDPALTRMTARGPAMRSTPPPPQMPQRAPTPQPVRSSSAATMNAKSSSVEAGAGGGGDSQQQQRQIAAELVMLRAALLEAKQQLRAAGVGPMGGPGPDAALAAVRQRAYAAASGGAAAPAHVSGLPAQPIGRGSRVGVSRLFEGYVEILEGVPLAPFTTVASSATAAAEQQAGTGFSFPFSSGPKWKKRYIVLDTCSITWYKSDEEVHAFGGMRGVKGLMPFRSADAFVPVFASPLDPTGGATAAADGGAGSANGQFDSPFSSGQPKPTNPFAAEPTKFRYFGFQRDGATLLLMRTDSVQEHLEWTHAMARVFNPDLYNAMFPAATATVLAQPATPEAPRDGGDVDGTVGEVEGRPAVGGASAIGSDGTPPPPPPPTDGRPPSSKVGTADAQTQADFSPPAPPSEVVKVTWGSVRQPSLTGGAPGEAPASGLSTPAVARGLTAALNAAGTMPNAASSSTAAVGGVDAAARSSTARAPVATRVAATMTVEVARRAAGTQSENIRATSSATDTVDLAELMGDDAAAARVAEEAGRSALEVERVWAQHVDELHVAYRDHVARLEAALTASRDEAAELHDAVEALQRKHARIAGSTSADQHEPSVLGGNADDATGSAAGGGGRFCQKCADLTRELLEVVEERDGLIREIARRHEDYTTGVARLCEQVIEGLDAVHGSVREQQEEQLTAIQQQFLATQRQAEAERLQRIGGPPHTGVDAGAAGGVIFSLQLSLDDGEAAARSGRDAGHHHYHQQHQPAVVGRVAVNSERCAVQYIAPPPPMPGFEAAPQESTWIVRDVQTETPLCMVALYPTPPPAE